MGDEVPFNRWGRVLEDGGVAYLLIEEEDPTGWKEPPPADLVQVCHRVPGGVVEPDDDDDNWTMSIHRADLSTWLAHHVVVEWLPDGVEPDWSTPEG